MARRAPTSPRSSPVWAEDVQIVNVTSAEDRDEFIKFQLAHYAADPLFVPPIVAERRDFLDPKRNQFFDNAKVALFLARRNGVAVGRIAVAIDNRYNHFHGTTDGIIGMFESQNDTGLAAALFAKASQWAAANGMRRIVGPMNLAMHHEVGVLVHGFDKAPSMMMSYNPAYYRNLFEANGFSKQRDMYTYELLSSQKMPEAVVAVADRLLRAGRVRVRTFDVDNPAADLKKLRVVFESMLKPGYGLAPITEAELAALMHRLRPVMLLRPQLSLIAEAQGMPVGFCITLSDTNSAQRKAQGYLFPVGLLKMLWEARRADRLRVLFLGIRAGWRRRGVGALLATEVHRRALDYGFSSAELGWAFEDDALMNRTIRATGAQHVKTHRLYERQV